VQSPVPGRIVIFRDGVIWIDESGIASKEVAITEPGVYRTEVYLPQLGNLPWIISNPIYVRYELTTDYTDQIRGYPPIDP